MNDKVTWSLQRNSGMGGPESDYWNLLRIEDGIANWVATIEGISFARRIISLLERFGLDDVDLSMLTGIEP